MQLPQVLLMYWYTEHENMRKPILGMTPIDQIWNSFITTKTISTDTCHAQFVTNSVFKTNLNFLHSWTCKNMHVKINLWPKGVFFILISGKNAAGWGNQFETLLYNQMVSISKAAHVFFFVFFFALLLLQVCNGRKTHSMCSNKEIPKSCC